MSEAKGRIRGAALDLRNVTAAEPEGWFEGIDSTPGRETDTAASTPAAVAFR